VDLRFWRDGEMTRHILAQAQFGTAATARFTLAAHLPGLTVRAISPNQGGNTGRVTVEIDGSALTPDTDVQLVSGVRVIQAVATDFRDATRLFATFDLTGQATGVFDVQVANSNGSSTVSGAFTIVAGVQNPLQYRFGTPDAFRVNRQTAIAIEFTNTGNTDIAAPILEVDSDNASFRLPEQEPSVGIVNRSSSREAARQA